MVSNVGAAALSGRRLSRNVLWNLLGHGAPLPVAVVAIPLLVEGLGTERFGVLALAWTLVGYFSLFDLGLGRALTKLVAEQLGAGHSAAIPGLARAALALMSLLGIAGGVLLAVLSPWLVRQGLNLPIPLQSETLQALYLLSLALPLVILSTGLRGILEAYQRFDLVNRVRIPLGLFTFLGPLAVLPFKAELAPMVAVLAAARLLSCGAYLALCLKLLPGLRGRGLDRGGLRSLLSLGGWMTVSNVLGPLMVYLDRFLIGALVSMSAVAYYTTPYEVITKLWIVPSALVGVLFPAFAAELVRDRPRAAWLLGRGMAYTALLLFPVILIVVTYAHQAMAGWLGPDFAQESARVLQWLAVGVFLNAVVRAPFVLIQSAGRPDLTAKLHVLQLPFYLLALWWSLKGHGIEGAAAVWAGRVLLDAAILLWLAGRLLPEAKLALRITGALLGVAVGLLAVAGLELNPQFKAGWLIWILLAGGFLAWRYLLDTETRLRMRRVLRLKPNL